MFRIFKPAIVLRHLALVLVLAAGMSAQDTGTTKPYQPSVASAPIPGQILAGRKVFISNADTSDPFFTERFSGGPDRPYNTFYAAMKSWGRYQLVSAPGDADLVFEIRFVSPVGAVSVTNGSGGSSRDPQFKVTILDAKTHFILWSITERPDPAFRRATLDKNFDIAAGRLIDDLKVLNGEPVEHPAPAQAGIVTGTSDPTSAR